MPSREEQQRLPAWFRIRLSTTQKWNRIRNAVDSRNLHTVCRSASCPNKTECWNAGTATFMILGDICSRSCGFCSVPKGIPANADHDEPRRIAEAIADLGLTYAVITSVTRDDLPDGGAGVFAATIRAVRSRVPGCGIEVLVPDFQGSHAALQTVLAALPDVLNHNLETIPSLYARVRPQADYRRSLSLLQQAAACGAMTKSGLMLGLGEGREELIATLHDLRAVGCSILTLGQYLRPGRHHLPVEHYYHADEFRELRQLALNIGFRHVAAGPRVRSSYHAGTEYRRIGKLSDDESIS